MQQNRRAAETDDTDLPWAGIFSGRERDMALLRAAWKRVSGEAAEPRVVVLLAESGLGKTRLAQELYRHLSTTADGEGQDGYWPDLLERQGNHLTLNPRPADCRPAHAMPFLWWGLRAQDPLGRGASPGDAVRSGVSVLRPHLENLLRAAHRLDLDARRDTILGKLAVDTALEILDATTFGLLGLLQSAAEGVTEYLDVRRARRGLQGEIDLGSIVDRERVSLVDTVLTDLAHVVKEPILGMAAVPAVLLIDDAQFIDSDPTLKELTLRAVRQARAEAWPLLVIINHWEREWHEACDRRDQSLPAQLASLLGPRWSPHVLGKVDRLDAMVDAGLPGLTAGQRSLLLDKADGNPRLMDEILRHLRSRPRFFEGRRVTAPLTARGESEIQISGFDLYKLVDDRFSLIPPEVRAAVSLSSLQGVRFVERVTLLALEALELPGASGDEPLRRAERPYAFVSRLDPGVAEFTQRVYHEVALDRLDDILEADRAREAVRRGLRQLAGESGSFAELEEDARQAAWDVGMAMLAYAGATPEDRRLLARCYVSAAKAAMAEWDDSRAAAYAGDFTGKLAGGLLSFEDVTLEDAVLLLRGAVEGERPESAGELADRLHGFLSGAAAAEPGATGALLWIAQAKADLQGFAAAEPFVRQGLELARAAFAVEDKEETRISLVWALTRLGELELELRGPEAAEPVYREALACAYGLLKARDSREAQRMVYVAVSNIGRIEESLRGMEAAEVAYRQALEAARAYRAWRDTPQARLDVVISLIRLGDVTALREKKLARPLYQEALAMARDLLAEHDTRDARLGLMACLAGLGGLEPPPAAEPLLQEALKIARGLMAQRAAPYGRQNVASMLSRLGDLQVSARDPGAAEPFYREALEIARGLLAVQDSRGARETLLASLDKAGLVLLSLGAREEARALFQEALDLALSLATESPSAKSRRNVVLARIRLHGARPRSPVPEPGIHSPGESPASAGFTKDAGSPSDPQRTAAVLADLATLLGPPPADLSLVATEYALPFYPGWTLYRLDGLRDQGGEGKHSFLLHTPGIAAPLNESLFVHAVSLAAPVRLEPSNIVSFLRFFCELVKGQNGPFLIVSGLQDLSWEEAPGPEVSESLLPALHPPRIMAEPSGDDPRWWIQACVLYGGALFRSTFAIRPEDGWIDMAEEELIRKTLEVIPYVDEELDLLEGWPAATPDPPGPEDVSFLEYCQSFIGYGRLPDNPDAGLVPWLHGLAEGGEVKAMSLLGHLYKNGRGVDRNPAEAVKWLQAAATAGDPLAMSSLGLLYARGEGTGRDDALSEQWLRRAGEGGGDEFRGFEKGDKALWLLYKLNRELDLPWRFPVSALSLANEVVQHQHGGGEAPPDSITRKEAPGSRELALRSGRPALAWDARLGRWVCDEDFSRKLRRVLRVFGPHPHDGFAGFLRGLERLLSPVGEPRLADCVIVGELYRKAWPDGGLAASFGPDDRELLEIHIQRLLELGVIHSD